VAAWVVSLNVGLGLTLGLTTLTNKKMSTNEGLRKGAQGDVHLGNLQWV